MFPTLLYHCVLSLFYDVMVGVSPLQYGLYTAFMGCFIYAVFGTSKDITLGPTAILSLLTATLIGRLHHIIYLCTLWTITLFLFCGQS